MEQQELEKLICESIIKVFKEYGIINEMAMPIKAYKARLEGLLPQIAVHWCLIYYHKSTNTPTHYIEHWSDELSAFFEQLAQMRLKSGDKLKVSYSVWNELDYDTNPENVYLIIRRKFIKEGINIKANYSDIINTCKAFVYSTRDIVTLICNHSGTAIDQYIENIGNKKIIFE